MKRMFFIPITMLFLIIVTGCALVNSFFFPGDLRGGSGSSSSSTGSLSADYISPNIGLLKSVPAGAFEYDTSWGDTNTLTMAFHLSQYLITRAQFSNVMGTDPVVAGGQTGYSSGASDPVMYVNWYQAIYFCNMLSIKEGLTPVYTVSNSGIAYTNPTNWPGGTNVPTATQADYDDAIANWSANGYRLPTEMEWMWAAMGATYDSITADFGSGGINTNGYSKAFAGSTGVNNISNYVWFGDNSINKTHPIGTKLPNELGLYDISGNVHQWCWDWTSAYPGGAQTDYKGQPSGTARVCRGGCWADLATTIALSSRSSLNPYLQNVYNGFRVVRR